MAKDTNFIRLKRDNKYINGIISSVERVLEEGKKRWIWIWVLINKTDYSIYYQNIAYFSKLAVYLWKDMHMYVCIRNKHKPAVIDL